LCYTQKMEDEGSSNMLLTACDTVRCHKEELQNLLVDRSIIYSCRLLLV
jgi:hypothetical protein